MARAAPLLASKPCRYDARAASQAALAAVLPAVTREDGRRRLSATTVHEYLACPFAWLLKRGLGLEDEPVGVDFFDARLAGNMAHSALQDLLGAMGGLGPVAGKHREAYIAAARKAVACVLPLYKDKEGPFLVPMFEAYAPLLEDRLVRLVMALLEEPGALAGKLELSLEAPYDRLGPPPGTVLEGRLDRLAVLPAKEGDDPGKPPMAIVDYKKRQVPDKKDLLSSARGAASDVDGNDVGAGELGDYQMASYLALCAANGFRVERASFWSIEKASGRIVVGEGGLMAATDCKPELDALEMALATVADGLAAGNFRPAAADADAEACEGCAWKGVCRERYATE